MLLCADFGYASAAVGAKAERLLYQRSESVGLLQRPETGSDEDAEAGTEAVACEGSTPLTVSSGVGGAGQGVGSSGSGIAPRPKDFPVPAPEAAGSALPQAGQKAWPGFTMLSQYGQRSSDTAPA